MHYQLPSVAHFNPLMWSSVHSCANSQGDLPGLKGQTNSFSKSYFTPSLWSTKCLCDIICSQCVYVYIHPVGGCGSYLCTHKEGSGCGGSVNFVIGITGAWSIVILYTSIARQSLIFMVLKHNRWMILGMGCRAVGRQRVLLHIILQPSLCVDIHTVITIFSHCPEPPTHAQHTRGRGGIKFQEVELCFMF